MLMTQKAHAEGMRALVLYTAWVQDQAISDPDAGFDRRNDLLLPLVKGYCSEKSYELLSMALQVFGGAGYTMDYPMEQYIRDARIDSIYEGTTGIQALDLFFRKIVRDQGTTLASLAGEIIEFVKGGVDDDALAEERGLLSEMLDDTQAHLGSMVEHLLASAGGQREEIYKVGFQTNHLLESMAETVIAWLLLRQAEIALPKIEQDPFYRGKVAAARWFIRHVAPKAAVRRAAADAENGALMDLPVAAF